jgi:hypothetical protein
MKKVTIRTIGVFATVAALGVSIPTAAFASSTAKSSTASSSFLARQQALEAQLASRATQLQHLVADVTAATSLSNSAMATLQARLSTEQASISALTTKVPTDTTGAELNADRTAMLKDNRVYVVMVPQVFEMIEASVTVKQVATLQGIEPMLQSEVASLAGQPGYKSAENHYNNFVVRLENWAERLVSLENVVLSQTPQGYPRNTAVFVSRNHEILLANTALAYAEYDASEIGLATGGYSGS